MCRADSIAKNYPAHNVNKCWPWLSKGKTLKYAIYFSNINIYLCDIYFMYISRKWAWGEAGQTCLIACPISMLFFFCPNVINAVCPKDKLHFPASLADWTNQWHKEEVVGWGPLEKEHPYALPPFSAVKWPHGSWDGLVGVMWLEWWVLDHGIPTPA